MFKQRPPLVIVSGAPNAGKTTLVRYLASESRLPFLTKDGFKEVLGDTLGAEDRVASQRLSAASFELLFAVTGWLLDAGYGAIVEANFRRGLSERPLKPLVVRARSALVHCEAPLQTLLNRHAQRIERAKRHAVHFDHEQTEPLRSAVEDGLFEPLDLDIPTLRVDTTDGYVPGLKEILVFVRAAVP
jgi:predicted kinase